MSFSEELKRVRQSCFLSQETFARKLNVSFSSVNRWEGDRAKPNLVAMKNIKDFCDSHDVDFGVLETEWFNIGKETQHDSK